MPWVVPKGQPSWGPPALSHLPHSQRPSPNSTCPPHSHSPCTHIHTYTIPQSRKCGGMCTHLCHTDPSTSELTGRTSVSHNSGGSFAHEHMCADHVPSHTHTDLYTAPWNAHEAPRRTKRRVQSACARVYTSASRHKHMHMHTRVSPRPCPATELFWAGPRANMVGDCQLPAGPSPHPRPD